MTRYEKSSHIDLYSVLLPRDNSGMYLLRSVGVPDKWINWHFAEMIHQTRYYSVFISYSTDDEVLAQQPYASLQVNGVRCRYTPEDMKIGDKICNRVDEAIHLQDKLLLLLSEHSITSSWVEDEAATALEKERQQREALFPIRLDESVMQATQP